MDLIRQLCQYQGNNHEFHMEKLVKIYVQLLDEGTPTTRPTEAMELGAGLFKVLPVSNYDPEDEKWEFPPGSVVKVKKTQGLFGEMLLAVAA
jgi:hypothetical protein